MIKFIIPAIIIFFIFLFWEKISEKIYKRFSIRINYLMISAILLAISVIVLLLNN
jgi:hypothetical protein